MSAFLYEALDAQGRKTQGVIEADSPRSARAALRAQGMVPVHVQAASLPGGKGLQRVIWRAPVLSASERAVWLRQLASLLLAGLPLERCLIALAEEARTPEQIQLMAQLRTEVQSGQGLAQALGDHPRLFKPMDVAVIAAGEQSGQLGRVIDALARDADQRLRLRNKILSAMLYPAIVSLISLAIVMFLLGAVVPRIAEVFTASRQALPWLTQCMLGMSAVVRSGWPWMLLAVLLGWLGLQAWTRQPQRRVRWDAFVLHWPLVGRMSLLYHCARMAATLSLLTGSGVPLLRALQTTADTLGNAALREQALALADWVREGTPLASGLEHQAHWPRVLGLFTRMGEQTGDLSGMLAQASAHMSEDVERRALTLTTWLEPVLVVVMGLVVLLIVLAVMLPIVEMNALVR
jgi:general secretion pathway protein F